EVPPQVEPLKEAILGHLPFIQIEDLLTDVDVMCGYSKAFVPIPGDTVRVDNPYPALLAAIIAHGTNIGMHSMAGS
ncbi:Tn3 family transposase, partial [Klebsiella pneumoniae]|uniref:Tn3 family transposase n=1 Tax=Klebsiella pneumoniae TaxID=573 RepID=UPI003EE07905